jgi:Flp pilus assembly protein TadB
MLCVLLWISPSYAGMLFNNWTGNVMLAVAGTSLILGWIVMNRMAALKA